MKASHQHCNRISLLLCAGNKTLSLPHGIEILHKLCIVQYWGGGLIIRDMCTHIYKISQDKKYGSDLHFRS